MTKAMKILALLSLLLLVCTGTAFASASIQVTLKDNGGSKTILTEEQTVAKFLEEQEITVGKKDSLDKSLDYVLQHEDTLTITRAFPVTMYIDGVPKLVHTTEKTVGALVAEQEAILGSQFDLNGVSADTALKQGMELQLTTKTVTTTTTVEPIPFTTEVVEVSTLAYGQETILQEGKNGQKEITVTETVIGGEVVDRQVQETMMEAPTKAIVQRGTLKAVTVSGETLSYKTALSVKATAYTPYDPGCNGITATGTKAGFGTLAVDPKVIPLGSTVYIPGYGVATATDTGGAIKGNRVDVCYESLTDALNWGVKNVTIYVLD